MTNYNAGMGLTSRQREVVKLIGSGMSYADAAAEIGLSESSVRSMFYAGMARIEGRRPPASRKYDRDADLDGETPREARARIARELAEGLRCCAPMLSGGPCSLLLPCFTHGGR